MTDRERDVEKLLPCPFCGKNVRIRSKPIGFGSEAWYIEHICKVSIYRGASKTLKGKKELIKRWNTRK
jgi:uncharacterized C2H2 Zn-finger protein